MYAPDELADDLRWVRASDGRARVCDPLFFMCRTRDKHYVHTHASSRKMCISLPVCESVFRYVLHTGDTHAHRRKPYAIKHTLLEKEKWLLDPLYYF